MNITIYPTPLHGQIPAPPSKSETLRLLLCAALYGNGTKISYKRPCDDVARMEACLAALSDPSPVLDCGDGAAVLRFLLPVTAALGKPATFRLSPGLARRPLAPFISLLNEHGAAITQDGQTVTASGRLRPGTYTVPTADTSQYLSGLLMALPLVGNCTINITSPLPSAGYVRLTLDTLSKFGIAYDRNSLASPETTGPQKQLSLASPERGGGPLAVEGFSPEGDWSSAAVWVCISAMPGHSVTVTGLSDTSLQPDRAVVSLSEQILKAGGTIDCTDTPDLLPVLAVLAAKAPAPVNFTGIARLRGKESDRISGTAELINSLGGHAAFDADTLTVTPTGGYTGGTADSLGDHRLVMAATLAACMSAASVTVRGAECVSKSYPGFWEDFARLGGRLQEETNL